HGSFGLIQLGEIRLGKEKLSSLLQPAELKLPGVDLAPGMSVAVCFNLGFLQHDPRSTLRVILGNHTFQLENAEKFVMPDGHAFQAITNSGNDPLKLAIMLSRGRGEKADRITWRIFGIYHDSMGETKLDIAPSATLPVRIQVVPAPGRIERVYIESITAGNTQAGLPELYHAPLWKEVKIPSVSHWLRSVRPVLAKKGIMLPKLGIREKYGKLTAEELELFKKFARVYPIPKSNRGNALMFGGAQTSASLAHVLEASDDPELLNILEKWCDSVLEYRNGGPHYSIAYLPVLPICTDKLELGKVYPIWPHLFRYTYIRGIKHARGDLSSGCCGPAILIRYAHYIVSRPQLWSRPSADPSMTCLQKAKKMVREVERTLSEFTLKIFAEPQTGRIHKPWNRYAELIETCVLLEDIYLRLKDHADFFDARKVARYHQVVHGMLDYFFDPQENYSEWTIERDGKPYTVMDYKYAPRYLHWGSYSESLGYSYLDFNALLAAHLSGRYRDILSDARIMIIRNTLRFLTFKGRNEKGDVLISAHIRGVYGGSPSMWGAGHMLVAFVDPSFYDEFIGDVIRKQDSFTSFGEYIQLREALAKRGIVEPSKRRLPVAKVTGNFKVSPGEKVILSAQTSRGQDLRYEWDVNRDGKPDYTTPEISLTFPNKGHYFILLKVIDGQGLCAYDQATILVQ
ncbi:MAG: hypothetical protein D6820_11990, partial [Lentisphaerae bacterium]